MRAAHALIVDDDADYADMVSDLLAHQEIRATAVHSAAQANAVLSDPTIDAVITDLLMPGTDGIEFIRQLRKARPDVRIVAISGGGKSLPASLGLNLAKALGADAVLYKPFSGDELRLTLDAI